MCFYFVFIFFLLFFIFTVLCTLYDFIINNISLKHISFNYIVYDIIILHQC